MNATTLAPESVGQEQRKGQEEQGRQAEQDDYLTMAGLLRACAAEMLGTFALTLAAAGGEVIAAVSHGEVSHAARAVAPGLVVMALIYANGNCSGAHFNPVVSLAFALRRVFPLTRVPAYWAMQFLGATLAALLLRSLFGGVAHLGATEAKHGALPAFVMEIALTWLLLTVILGTASRFSLVGPNAALAVGGTIALCGLFAGPISGASMNPARSLGPMLASGQTSQAWIYLAGPVVGSIMAVLVTTLLHGEKKDPKEQEAAEGENK